MSRFAVSIILAIALLILPGCGQSVSGGDAPGNAQAQPDQAKSRISFAKDAAEDVSYFQHVEKLWEQTKPLLREDLAQNYSDEEYQALGADIDTAWVNLQIHGSLAHAEEAEAISDVKFNNLTPDILMLISQLYGTRDTGSAEEREENREKLRNGRLEYKIKEFDETIARVKKSL